MLKTALIILLMTAIFTLFGYAAIEHNYNKFEQLCKNHPEIPQCVKEFGGEAL